MNNCQGGGGSSSRQHTDIAAMIGRGVAKINIIQWQGRHAIPCSSNKKQTKKRGERCMRFHAALINEPQRHIARDIVPCERERQTRSQQGREKLLPFVLCPAAWGGDWNSLLPLVA